MKPGELISTAYLPGGTAAKRKPPSSSVRAVNFRPVSLFERLTSAPKTTAHVGSMTTPENLACEVAFTVRSTLKSLPPAGQEDARFCRALPGALAKRPSAAAKAAPAARATRRLRARSPAGQSFVNTVPSARR